MCLKNFFTTNILFVSVLMLSACGGGGGGGDEDDMSSSSTSSGAGSATLTTADFVAISGAAATRSNSFMAASSTPQSGSVVQTSVTSIGSAIDARATYNNGSPHISVTLNGRSFNTAASNVDVFERFETVDVDTAGLYAYQRRADGELYTKLYTDIESAGDTDYLAGGIWFYVPDDASNLADGEVGVFVDGNDPFEQANIAGLTGTATYNGGASGLYLNANSDELLEIASDDAVLTANFGSSSALGTIEGTITDFGLDDGSLTPIIPTFSVTLSRTNIGASDSGFFTGDTTATYQGVTYDQGKWGGQFYGNGATATALPNSVLGTFGVAGDDPADGYILGAFSADR